MNPGTTGLIDTSVLIAQESGRQLDVDRLPTEGVVSVVTLAELHAGVLAASDLTTRATRMSTLDAMRDVEIVPVDQRAALVWARMRAELAGTGRRVPVNGLWIAASAAATGIPVYTQDSDFDPLIGVAGLEVVRV